MKRFLIAVLLFLGIGLMFTSCEKMPGGGTSSKLVGTWDFVEEEGDYVVITATTITFFYADGNGLDDGIPYKYEYEHPHIFIAGINFWDVVSISGRTMVWQSPSDKERVTLKKR